MSQTRIPDALERIFLRVGWFNIYSRHIPDLQQPNFSNEMAARCPFRDIVDNNASFSVNAGTGLFSCFRTGRAGNYLQFRSYFDSTHFGPDGLLIPIDIRLVEEMVMREEGIVPPSEEWVNTCHLALVQSPEAIQWIQQFKPWFVNSLSSLQIGYDWETASIVIPVRDETGKLINAKLYNPINQPKMRWFVSGLSGNFLFPHTAINEDNLILVEGETDVITLRGLGFNAISGTQGGNAPMPMGQWYRSRNVTVLTDEDMVGERARQTCINAMRSLANEVRSARIPEWENRPSGTDISDYVQYLIVSENNEIEIRNAIIHLIENAEIASSLLTAFDGEPQQTQFTNILNHEQVFQRLQFIGRVSARSETRYIGVTRYGLNCPGKGHKFCSGCPMAIRYGGSSEFFLDRRSQDQLKLIGVNDEQRLKALQKINGIPVMCPSVDMTPLEWVGYEPTEISASLSETETNNEMSVTERHRREAYFIVNADTRIEENRDYDFKGFLYPDPKTQSGLIVIDSAEPLATTAEKFIMTEEIAESLSIFKPTNEDDISSVIDKLNKRADDLCNSVTDIKGRLDLHLAISLVFHSALNFHIGPKKVKRGWLELLILGDTKAGKSTVFQTLSQHYQIGELIDCKNHSLPGLLGTVNTSSITGERYITAGKLPENDGGIVCLDEMQGAKNGQGIILDALALMRSEGIVTITKAARAKYRARVRLICVANPGKGLLISETGKTGAQLMTEMIPQPENISRFDAAITVAQNDVTQEEINNSNGLIDPIYDPELQRTLLHWIYSRKSHQINFTQEAQDHIRHSASVMCQKYDSALPIVEPSDQKTRIAKWSVAIAGFLFSSDNENEEIIVRQSHVIAAQTLLEFFYDKFAMGYDRFSMERREKRILQDEPEIRKTFDTFGEKKYKIAKQLLLVDEISDRSFRNIVNGPMATATLQSLIHNNCLKLVYSGRKDSYEKNPIFTQWLMMFVSEGG